MSEQEIKNAEGGYIFISHAYKDINRIRKIRNILEENGFEPIMFYLRCLSDHDEIVDLIKREIDAREWFLLVDSENARQSDWVKAEIEYIRSKNTDKIVSVNLEDNDSIRPILDRLSNSMRIFLSYSRKDYYLARMIADKCIERDLKVFFDVDSVCAGDSFADQIHSSIKEASEKGCVVLFISSDYLQSEWAKRELESAVANNGFILPVIVNDVELTDFFEFYLRRTQYYKLKTPVTMASIEEIVGIIENMLIKRLHEI